MSQNTPLPVDPFSRTMSEGFDNRNRMPQPGGFAAFFGVMANGAEVTFNPNSNAVDIDIILGTETIAPMIPRAAGQGRVIKGQKVSVEEERFSSLTRTYPLIEIEGDIQSSQLNNRVFGESQTESDKTKRERLQSLAGKLRAEAMRRVGRTYETLCTESVLTGKQSAVSNTTNDDFKYDWKRPAGNFITVGTAWTDVAAPILSDVDAGCEQIREVAHMNPDMMILSGVDMDSFLKNTQVKEMADNRRFELIEVSTNNPVPNKYQRFVDGGFIPRGRLRTPKGFELWMFTYIDVYTDLAGVTQKYLPDNTTVIASSDARCDVHFGPSETMPMTEQKRQWYVEMFGLDMSLPSLPINFDGTNWFDWMRGSVYCDAYLREGEKGVSIRNQAAPLFPTTETAAFVTITTAP